MSEEPTKQEPPESGKNISRREFMAAASVAVTALAAGPILTLPAKNKPESSHGGGGEHKWGMLIDINLCIGCSYCTYACQAVNDLLGEMEYNVVTVEKTHDDEEFYLSRPCMQCDNAPCVHVCPVGATYVRDDGIITMDYDLCIGCRYCEVACPYEARVFNWKKYVGTNSVVPQFGTPEVGRRPRGVMEKCTFCEHRIDPSLERGLVPGVDPAATPACVVACPTGARVFGDLNDPESPVSLAINSCRTPIRLREELSTQPKVYYIPPKSVQAEEA